MQVRLPQAENGKISFRPSQPIAFNRTTTLLILILAFISSRAFYYSLGLRFDAQPLASFLQYIDPQLLKNNLLESVFYLHGQPPLFNLFLGTVLKVFPDSYVAVFHLVYLVTGLAFLIALYLLLERIGVPNWLAAVLTLIFMVAPSTVLYENWLFYTYPLAAILCVTALFLHKWLTTESTTYGMIFFSSLGVLVLTRSIFTISWFILFVVIPFVFVRHNRKRILYACAFPLGILCLISLKNFYVFGRFSIGYAYLGPNLAGRMVGHLPADLRNSLVGEGKISRLAFAGQLAPISQYADITGKISATGVAVLDSEIKSTGFINLHHIGYIRLSALYLNDAKYLIANYPITYFKSLSESALYFFPSSYYAFVEANPTYSSIRRLDRYFNAIFCGQIKSGWLGLFLLIGFPILVTYGIMFLFKSLRETPRDAPLLITAVFIVFNILYVSIVTTLISSSDYNRYRFKVDAFYVTMLGLMLTDGWRRLKHMLSAGGCFSEL